MDQTIFNWLFVGFGAATGWVMKIAWDAIKELKTDMKQIERDLPEIYVRKDDFNMVMADVKDVMKELRIDMKEGFSKVDTTLGMLFEKLERKKNRE
jgi:hypothetical protein